MKPGDKAIYHDMDIEIQRLTLHTAKAVDSCFDDHYIATRALVLHDLRKRKFPYALRY